MDFLKYKMGLPNGMPSDTPLQIELQRLQLELQRRDAIIEEQQKRIFQLEDEVKRCNKQIQELVVQLATYKDQKSKNDVSYKPPQSRYWTAEEHDRFLEAVKRYGSKDVKAIANYVGTRNPTQVRTHAQKYYLRLERERKRRDEEGITRKDGDYTESHSGMDDESQHSDNNQASPKSDLDNNNPDAAPSGSNDSNNPQTNSTNNIITTTSTSQSDEKDEKKTTPKKRDRATNAGRRASLPSDIATVRTDLGSPPTGNVVHSTRQQLQAAAPIVSQLKGWSLMEYNAFIEGLLSFPEEKDINKKCKLISERFLPKYTPEDIKQCYAILHNYIRNNSPQAHGSPMGGIMSPMAHMDETTTTFLDSAKRLKTDNHGFTVPSYTTTAMPSDSMHLGGMPRYNVPYQQLPTRGGYPYTSYNLPLSSVASPAMVTSVDSPYGFAMNPYTAMGQDNSMLRRASYPLDGFSANKPGSPEDEENGSGPHEDVM